MNPCDSFLWEYLKDRVFQKNPHTFPELKTAIQWEIEAISTEILTKGMLGMSDMATKPPPNIAVEWLTFVLCIQNVPVQISGRMPAVLTGLFLVYLSLSR